VRHLLFPVIGLALVATFLGAADTKDSSVVAATRKKLQTKINVEYSNTPLKEVLGDLKQQVADAAGGEVSFYLAPGVSMNQTITFKAKDKPVVEVLDGMFKKNGLGYIISKKKDRYEGWVQIKQGKERGDELTAEKAKPADKTSAKNKPAPKGKTEKKEKPASKPKPEDDPDKDEKNAARKLSFAETLIGDGKTEKAKERLQDIIQMYPKTKAAASARALLKQLNEKPDDN
jgi:hypothetical protein